MKRPLKPTDETMNKKLSSRKFIVWIVWLLILVAIIALSIVVTIITKSIPDAVAKLLSSVLMYFFIISAAYLGVNLLQKGMFASHERKMRSMKENKE